MGAKVGLAASILLSSSIMAAIYPHAWVAQSYPSWVNSCTSSQTPPYPIIDDVIHLRGGFTGTNGDFCKQGFGNPKILIPPSGEWYIYGNGDSDMSDSTVGDAIYLIIRQTNGQYNHGPGSFLTMPIQCKSSFVSLRYPWILPVLV